MADKENKLLKEINNLYTTWNTALNGYKSSDDTFTGMGLDRSSLISLTTNSTSNDPADLNNFVNGGTGELIARQSQNWWDPNPNEFGLAGARQTTYAEADYLDTIPEVHSALDTYADEASATDENGTCIHIESSNSLITRECYNLWKRIEGDSRIWSYYRGLSKYGDHFLELVIDDENPERGIVKVKTLPAKTMWRVQTIWGRLLEYQQGATSVDIQSAVKDFGSKGPGYITNKRASNGNIRFAKESIVHIRIKDDSGQQGGLYGTSILSTARRPAHQLRLMEDAMLIYRLIRAPERRIYYIDIGTTAPNKVEEFLGRFRDKFKRRKVKNNVSGTVDERYNPLPIRKDSIIPLLDGREITIEELAKEYEEGKENWVYSVLDNSNGEIVPGKVQWCGKNYTCENIHRVWLDNETFIDTAPEHPFLLRNGKSKRADELQPGDSLMPLYKRLSAKEDCNSKMVGYDMVKQNHTNNWEFTHILSCDEVAVPYNHQVKLVEVLTNEKDDVYCATIVGQNNENDRHNFAVKSNKINTTDTNSFVFVLNSVEEDFFLPVRGQQTGTRIDTLPGACLALDTEIPLLDGHVRTLQELIDDYNNGVNNIVYSCHPETGQIAPGKISWAGVTRKDTEVVKITFDNGKSVTVTLDHKFPVVDKGMVEAQNLCLDDVMIPYDVNDTGVYDSAKRVYINNCDIVDNLFDKTVNHSKDHLVERYITNIEFLEEKIDTGTLTIDADHEIHDWHTFALNCGVFTKNSNLNEIADVSYFRRIFYVALKIPPGWLEQDINSQSNRLALSSQDIRFAKTIGRIQKEMANAIREVFERHLLLIGIPQNQIEDLKVTMVPSSPYYELSHAEIIDARINRASLTLSSGIYSPYDVFTKILKHSHDEAIDLIRRLRESQIDKIRLDAYASALSLETQTAMNNPPQGVNAPNGELPSQQYNAALAGLDSEAEQPAVGADTFDDIDPTEPDDTIDTIDQEEEEPQHSDGPSPSTRITRMPSLFDRRINIE